MNIIITGGSGFVGTHLSDFLLNAGHRITALGRSAEHKAIRHESYTYVSADTTRPGDWQKVFEEADAVINLAGTTIFKRWTASYKKQIYESRVLTTRNVVAAMPRGKSITFCSASGAGYYGNRGDDILKEDEAPGDDFLAGVSVDWEKEALEAADNNIRVVVMRFGVILARDGGAMAKMIPAFKSFVGGSMGSGLQWFPWIHLADLISAVCFILDDHQISGPVNFCAPEPIRYRDLAKNLGQALNRPAVMPAPAFLIRLVMGEFGNVFLASQRTVPDKLLNHGFSFRYPNIKDALGEIVGN